MSWSDLDITISVPWYLGLMFRTRKEDGVLMEATAGASSRLHLQVREYHVPPGQRQGRCAPQGCSQSCTERAGTSPLAAPPPSPPALAQQGPQCEEEREHEPAFPAGRTISPFMPGKRAAIQCAATIPTGAVDSSALFLPLSPRWTMCGAGWTQWPGSSGAKLSQGVF